jgi:hypothetical protein
LTPLAGHREPNATALFVGRIVPIERVTEVVLDDALGT